MITNSEYTRIAIVMGLVIFVPLIIAMVTDAYLLMRLQDRTSAMRSHPTYRDNLCCDISDSQNDMCWGCYTVWYETQTDFEKEETE